MGFTSRECVLEQGEATPSRSGRIPRWRCDRAPWENPLKFPEISILTVAPPTSVNFLLSFSHMFHLRSDYYLLFNFPKLLVQNTCYTMEDVIYGFYAFDMPKVPGQILGWKTQPSKPWIQNCTMNMKSNKTTGVSTNQLYFFCS